MKRRAFLKGAGAVGVLVVGGGVWRAYDQRVLSVGRGPAYEPWKDWRGRPAEGPLVLVRAAILASNPHNTQPWLFRVSDTQIDLYADTVRQLGAFDPYLREMHIGLGCALENMGLAAEANGYVAKVNLTEGRLGPIPEHPRRTLVASVALAPGPKAPSKLFEAIPHRHTNRAAYERDKSLSPELLSSIRRIAESDVDFKVFLFARDDRGPFSEAVIKATETIVADSAMMRDSGHWFRHRWTDVQRFRDGVTLDVTGMSPLMAASAKMLPPLSPETSHRYWLDATRDVQVPTTAVFGLIAVRNLYDRPQTMRAGRAWQRMHLLGTTQGVAMQPINQPVELVDRERQLSMAPHAARVLADLIGDPDWKPTFAFRMGYPKQAASPSPRRPTETVVL
jgi:hypothetical protein